MPGTRQFPSRAPHHAPFPAKPAEGVDRRYVQGEQQRLSVSTGGPRSSAAPLWPAVVSPVREVPKPLPEGGVFREPEPYMVRERGFRRPRDFKTKCGTVSPGPATPRVAKLPAAAERQYVSELHMSEDPDAYTVVLAAPGSKRSDFYWSIDEEAKPPVGYVPPPDGAPEPVTHVLRVSNAAQPAERKLLSWVVDAEEGVPVYAAPSASAPRLCTKPQGERLQGYAPVHFWVALTMGDGWIRVGERAQIGRPTLRLLGDRPPLSVEEATATDGFARYLALPDDIDLVMCGARGAQLVTSWERGGFFTLTIPRRAGAERPRSVGLATLGRAARLGAGFGPTPPRPSHEDSDLLTGESLANRYGGADAEGAEDSLPELDQEDDSQFQSLVISANNTPMTTPAKRRNSQSKVPTYDGDSNSSSPHIQHRRNSGTPAPPKDWTEMYMH